MLLPSSTSATNVSLDSDPSYIYTLNILGERVQRNLKNQVLFDVFEDGKIIKFINK